MSGEPSLFHARCRGFTLAELLFTMAIVAILSSLAISAYQNQVAKSRVRDAAESIHSLFQQARAEASIRDTNLSVIIDTTSWCVGLNDTASCDCTQDAGPTACALEVAGEPVLFKLTGDEFPNVSISESFPAVHTTFGRIRRNASPAGTVSVTSGEYSLEIKVGLTGRIRVCVPEGSNFVGYPACS